MRLQIILILVFFDFSCKQKDIVMDSVTSSLKISEDKKHLVSRDGKPFFYLGDTGWELIHRLNREEMKMYLDNRSNKGFNVIQTVAIGELEGHTAPNFYGDLPFRELNVSFIDTTAGNATTDSIAYDFWDHLDYMLELAAERNMYVGLLPCWGEYVTPRFRETAFIGDSVSAYNYGHFLGTRFKKYDKIIWILGGDRLPDETSSGVLLWRSMAEGINDAVCGNKNFDKKSDYNASCMTYHSFYPSSLCFENDQWIDFHMWGSYHEKKNNDRAFEIPQYMAQMKNVKPNINSEPAYEESAVNYQADARFGMFDDFDVRQSAYWSVFAGTCGHTYGCGPVWQMFNRNTYNKSSNSLSRNWFEALDVPGAFQMKYLKELMEKCNFSTLTPAPEVFHKNLYDAEGQLKSCRNNQYILVYVPTGKTIELVMGLLKGKRVKQSWYNPRNGEYTNISEVQNSGIGIFNPPGEAARGNDWVLVLEII